MSNQYATFTDTNASFNHEIEIEYHTTWEDIHEELAEAYPAFDVDTLILSDVDGGIISRYTYDDGTMLDLENLTPILRYCSDNSIDEDAMAAFLKTGRDYRQFEEAFIGKFDSVEEFGYETMKNKMDIPSELHQYINFEQYGEDMLMYEFTEINDYYFRT